MLSHEATRRKVIPREFGKRALDIAICVLASPMLALVSTGVWIAIHLDSPGPALFRQRRIGRDEKPFTCFKFRTLRHNADENVHREAIRRAWANEPLSNDPAAPYKLTDDPRVTRVGRWLRRTSLDELPQFLNVLRGEMSIVGPRPAIPYELEYFRDWHHTRHIVKPGITGLCQVRGRGRVSPEVMLEMDVEYAMNWTLWTDLKLIALTFPVVLRGHGAR
ncbi:UDP-phosphate galactose phosphotransferase [Bradyrhizobium sacchari]|uniref:Lipopolysaccharide/colanic/teichoic acid biosynthesis glycosyltransferase n=1 Tax=Bradyrhizobium sacchari TaxID=1399419 RepID=A0A560KMX4_9BRAD|nr:sugar transferase [Bradyrhizobium sacchari]OPY94477.1 UDP-phosphate galactose phosphotransferase [Bradyrhizobium sacchari]TWB67368.1 lipopolysaccharide/colanic/teichoic acid biosynthesis glycosyltransferase [Bradyrhizobium sacchari]TWB84605.1 lipopolysaccharide/colanic/teichoic acid biosynthesis glycosyltransferase [Bradyrhizobium sacchari]